MLFTFVFLYVLNSQIFFEKAAYQTIEECLDKGQARIVEMEANPKYDGGLFVDCIPLPGVEVKAN